MKPQRPGTLTMREAVLMSALMSSMCTAIVLVLLDRVVNG